MSSFKSFVLYKNMRIRCNVEKLKNPSGTMSQFICTFAISQNTTLSHAWIFASIFIFLQNLHKIRCDEKCSKNGCLQASTDVDGPLASMGVDPQRRCELYHRKIAKIPAGIFKFFILLLVCMFLYNSFVLNTELDKGILQGQVTRKTVEYKPVMDNN